MIIQGYSKDFVSFIRRVQLQKESIYPSEDSDDDRYKQYKYV